MGTITSSQASYLRDLTAERDLSSLSDDQCFWLRNRVDDFSREAASRAIEQLKALPFNAVRAPLPDASELPAARYSTGPEGSSRFFQIDRPGGRWAGRVFAVELFGSPGDYRKERRRAREVVDLIQADGVEESMRQYGQRSTVCGVCHSPLTNDESIAFGIGPVCRGRLGI